MTCNSDLPNVTARARREPAVTDAVRTQRGPGSRAWKARPVPSYRPDPSPMPQVRPVRDRPLLTVRDRQMPVLRAGGGHGRRGPTALQHGGDGHKLNWRVRPVHDDHYLVGKPSAGGAAARGRMSAPELIQGDRCQLKDCEALDVFEDQLGRQSEAKAERAADEECREEAAGVAAEPG